MRLRGFPVLRGVAVAAALAAFLFVFPTRATAPIPPGQVFDDALWVAQDHSLLRVGSSDGRILFEIGATGEIGALAIDPVRSTVWAFGPGRTLRAYSFTGSPLILSR